MGVVALKLSFELFPNIFGVLKLGVGSASASNSNYTPTGTELVFFIAEIDPYSQTVPLRLFYIESTFTNSNCGMSSKSLGLYDFFDS